MEKKDFCLKIYGGSCEGCKYVNTDFQDCANRSSHDFLMHLWKDGREARERAEQKRLAEFRKKVVALKKKKAQRGSAKNVVFVNFGRNSARIGA